MVSPLLMQIRSFGWALSPYGSGSSVGSGSGCGSGTTPVLVTVRPLVTCLPSEPMTTSMKFSALAALEQSNWIGSEIPDGGRLEKSFVPGPSMETRSTFDAAHESVKLG